MKNARERGARVVRTSIQLHVSYDVDDKASGVMRFLREEHGVEPTAAGRILLDHADRVLGEARSLRERFERRRETQEGSVIFGMIPTIAPYLLPRVLGPFR